MNFAGFSQWNVLLDYVGNPKEFKHLNCLNNGRIYYHAPMNRNPVEIEVVKRFKNGSLRIKVKHSNHGSFIVDSSHLDRFRILA